MGCFDCPKASECHNDLVNDLSIINTAVSGLNKGHMFIAIESMEILQKRFEKRMLIQAGRAS